MTKGNFNIHILTPSGEKLFDCKHCGKCYKTTSSLNSHLHTHYGVKPHNCEELCSHLEGLEEQQLIHTDTEPYCCDMCSRKFRRFCYNIYYT